MPGGCGGLARGADEGFDGGGRDRIEGGAEDERKGEPPEGRGAKKAPARSGIIPQRGLAGGGGRLRGRRDEGSGGNFPRECPAGPARSGPRNGSWRFAAAPRFRLRRRRSDPNTADRDVNPLSRSSRAPALRRAGPAHGLRVAGQLQSTRQPPLFSYEDPWLFRIVIHAEPRRGVSFFPRGRAFARLGRRLGPGG